MPLPSTAPAMTSVGKCWPADTRNEATAAAAPYASNALRVRCGRCSRPAITKYVVAAANATDACPDGNERRLSGSDAAPGAAAVYSTGRLRWASTLTDRKSVG